MLGLTWRDERRVSWIKGQTKVEKWKKSKAQLKENIGNWQNTLFFFFLHHIPLWLVDINGGLLMVCLRQLVAQV